MRDLTLLNSLRRPDLELALYGEPGGPADGIFRLPHPSTGVVLHVIASSGYDWDHVSVSLLNRCPNWQEMEHAARMFFRDDETAMQLHIPAVEHIDCHPYCLHWWRPQAEPIPRPPGWMVGPK
jgi:hypothetical protein